MRRHNATKIEKNVAEKKANPKLLQIKLQDVDPTAIGMLRLPQRLDMLGLFHLSDAALAKISSIPKCREAMLSEPSLSAEGWKRLASLLPGIEALHIDGSLRADDKQPLPTNLEDDALGDFAAIATLTDVELFNFNVSDAGITRLQALPQLKRLAIGGSPRVTGVGFEKLAGTLLQELVIGNLQIDSNGVKAIGTLSHLELLASEEPDFRDQTLDALEASAVWSKLQLCTGCERSR